MIRNYVKSFSSLENGEVLKKLSQYRTQHRQKYVEFNSQFNHIMGLRYEDGIYNMDQIGPVKQKKVDFIYEQLNSLSIQERLYFNYMLKKQINNMNECTSPLKIQKNDSEMQKVVHKPNKQLDPNRQKQQELISELIMVGEQGFQNIFKAAGNLIVGGGSGSNNISDSDQQQQQSKQQEEVVIEKTNFDVELTAIDASQKIKIIKEVRSICGLGLKEAKEAVEKLPNVIAKQATKGDAESMVEKLKKLGCTLEMK